MAAIRGVGDGIRQYKCGEVIPMSIVGHESGGPPHIVKFVAFVEYINSWALHLRNFYFDPQAAFLIFLLKECTRPHSKEFEIP
jgi:hypothetical protein